MTVFIIFTCLILLLLTGIPIFAALGLTATAILLVFEGGIGSVADTVFSHLNKTVLTTIPLFVFMAQVLIRAKVIDDAGGDSGLVMARLRVGSGTSLPASTTPATVEVQRAAFSRSEYRVDEGAGSVVVTVTRIGGATGDLSVDFLTQDAYANEGQASLVRALPAERTVVVAIRSPYDLLAYPDVQTYLLTYSGADAALSALARMLYGRVGALGRLPVDLP